MENENQGVNQNEVVSKENKITFNTQPMMDSRIAFHDSPPAISIQQSTEPVSSDQIKYAGFWIRYVANIIDGFLIGILFFIIGIIIGIIIIAVNGLEAVKGFHLSKGADIAVRIIGMVVGWIYFVWMTKKYQATLGKKAVGIKVMSDKSEELTLGRVILRETIGKLISAIILYIGYIMVGFTKRKQALHDKIAGTVVVYKDSDNSKIKWWAIALALILPAIAIIGILASIVLVSLSSARNKATDASIKASLSSSVPAAWLYEDEKGSFLGFQLQNPLLSQAEKCSGKPILNISPNGKNLAIFAKLCVNPTKYFCVDINNANVEVDESYARSGASSCSVNSTDTNTTDIETKKEVALEDFSNEKLGYSIKYPQTWVKDETAKDSDNFMVPGPDGKVMAVITINDSQILPGKLEQAFKETKAVLLAKKAKIYDEKDFIYTSDTGDKITGKQMKQEISLQGNNVKQWIILLPTRKNKVLEWIYTASPDNYGVYSQEAIDILSSWKLN